jgi:hypothetical protein
MNIFHPWSLVTKKTATAVSRQHPFAPEKGAGSTPCQQDESTSQCPESQRQIKERPDRQGCLHLIVPNKIKINCIGSLLSLQPATVKGCCP